IAGGRTVQMDADGPGIPAKGIVIVAQCVPTGIKRRMITAQWSGSSAEFFLMIVFNDGKACAFGEIRRTIDFPVPCSVSEIGNTTNISPIAVKAADASESMGFRVQRFIH